MGKKARSKQDALLPPAGRSTPEAQQNWARAVLAQALSSNASISPAVGHIEQEVERQLNIIARSTELLAIQGRGRPAACAKGCSFCCRQQVTASIPEVLRVAEYIRESYTAEQQAALKQRFAAYREGIGSFTVVGVSHHRNPCPLLIDDACSVRPARPIVCRGWNSIDVRVCEQKFHDPLSDIRVPAVGTQAKSAKAFEEGMREACTGTGLDPMRVDFAVALEIALEDPDAEAKWRRGLDPFAVASVGGAATEA